MQKHPFNKCNHETKYYTFCEHTRPNNHVIFILRKLLLSWITLLSKSIFIIQRGSSYDKGIYWVLGEHRIGTVKWCKTGNRSIIRIKSSGRR